MISALLVACDGPSPADGGMDGGSRADAGRREDAGAGEGGAVDAVVADAGPVDAGPPDAGPEGPVDVSHPRELRASWITTVFALDFPSRPSLSEAEARAELIAAAEAARRAGLNAVYFQVRPESDALYESALEPWSRFLTGTQGTDPGYDPLGILIEEAHARGIEVHAWLNPFRGLTSTEVTAAPTHVTRRFPEAAIPYGSGVTMDPSSEAVRAHIVAVVADLVTRFDIDGVVFDDYFYPYPAADGSPFPDDAQYADYVGAGGVLGKSDWRRSNVDQLVEAVAEAIRARKPWVRWGIAPFGIYRPGMPPEVTGLDAYEVIATDPLRWLAEGWVDYLAPQLYWPTTSTGQPFEPLLEWWAARAPAGRPIVPTLALFRLGTSTEWSAAEFEAEIRLVRTHDPSTAGHTLFRHGFLQDDVMGAASLIGRLDATPARPPVVPATAGEIVAMPEVEAVPGGVLISHPDRDAIAGFAVYREVAGAWVMERWLLPSATAAALAPGVVAVSAIARGGSESRGLRLHLP